MASDDFEREVARRASRIEVPLDSQERIIEAARRGAMTARAPRRTGLRRRWLIVGTALLLVLGGGAATALVVIRDGDDGLTVDVAPGADITLSESEFVGRLPWLRQASGAPRIDQVGDQPSLVFPPGTTYASAIEQLFLSVVGEGGLPAQAELEAPLPSGRIWSPGEGEARPALDLRAPWGYDIPSGRISTPSFSVLGSVSPPVATAIRDRVAGGTPVGAGVARAARVDVPRLAPCQILLPAKPTRACRLS